MKAAPPADRAQPVVGLGRASGGDQLQALTVPALTPCADLVLLIQPASMTTLRLSLVIGDRRQEDARSSRRFLGRR